MWQEPVHGLGFGSSAHLRHLSLQPRSLMSSGQPSLFSEGHVAMV